MAAKVTERRKDYAELINISAQIGLIFDILNKIQQTEAARVEREKVLSETTTELGYIIIGNGKPGLKTDVKLLQEQQARVNWVGGLVMVAIIADIVSRILATK